MSATWFNQPLNIDFSTTEGAESIPGRRRDERQLAARAYRFTAESPGWHPERWLPWDGKVAIELPYRGNASYKVDVTADLKNVAVTYLHRSINGPVSLYQ